MVPRLFLRISFPLLIVFAAAFSPLAKFYLARDLGFHDNQRIIEVFCSVLSAIMAAVCVLRNVSIRLTYNDRALHWLMLFLFLGLLSSIFSYSPRYAGFEWANFLLLFAMSCLIAGSGKAVLEPVLRLCGLGCAFYIFVEIILYAALIHAGGQPSNAMLIHGFDNYRFFNHIQTITLPLLALLTCRSNDGKQKIFAWVVTSIWWALLFVSAGRGTCVGLLAGMCVTWFYLRQDALPWSRVMLQSALIGLSLYFVFYVLIPLSLSLQPFGFLFSVVGRTIENPDSSRWPLWMRAWEIILAHPWLGAGPLHFAHFGRDLQIGAHPHNWVLQIASEWGIPALLCLVASIALGFKKLLATRQYLAPADVKNHLILAAWLTTGVAILVDGLVSGLIVMPTSQLWIAIYVGCAWGWAASITPVTNQTTLRLPLTARICGAIGLLAAIYFLANGLWPEILNLPLYEEQNLQKDLYADPVYRPRIWLGGYF